MNIIDAAHKTVHAYPGGSESLAPRIGMSAAVLRNKVNPNNTTHHLTLAEANEIMGVTGDDRMLHELAAQHGYVLSRIDHGAPDASVMGAMLVSSAKQGAFFQELQAALSDGLITENEMGRLAETGTDHMASMVTLLNVLRRVTGKHGVGA